MPRIVPHLKLKHLVLHICDDSGVTRSNPCYNSGVWFLSCEPAAEELVDESAFQGQENTLANSVTDIQDGMRDETGYTMRGPLKSRQRIYQNKVQGHCILCAFENYHEIACGQYPIQTPRESQSTYCYQSKM